MSFFGKTATVRFVRLAYLDFSYNFPIETTNEPFGLKNINKPVRALGPKVVIILILILHGQAKVILMLNTVERR